MVTIVLNSFFTYDRIVAEFVKEDPV